MGLPFYWPVKLLKSNKLWIFIFLIQSEFLFSVIARPRRSIYDRLTRGLIRPLTCYYNETGESGICMFTLNCFEAKGTPLTTCKDGIFLGSCCQLPPDSELALTLAELPSNDLNPSLPHVVTSPWRWKTTSPRPTTLSASKTSVVTSVVTSFGIERTTIGPTSTRSSVTKTSVNDNDLISEVLSNMESETNPAQTGSNSITSGSWKVTPADSSSTLLLVTRKPVTSPVTPSRKRTTTPKPAIIDWAIINENKRTSTTTQRYKPMYQTPQRKPIATSTDRNSIPELPHTTLMKTTVYPSTTTTTRRTPTTVKTRPPMTTTPTPTTTTPTTTTEFNLENADFKEACGRTFYNQNIPTGRIVGGKKSEFGKWPWQVSLRQWKKNTFTHKCGAALLNENWAISAAHCVDNVPVEQLQVRIGDFDVNSVKEPLSHVDRQVQIIAKHPDFNPRNFENDLALVRFYEPTHFRQNIIPICIPQDDNSFVNDTAYVTGWGRLYEDGPLPDELHEAQIPIISNLECEKLYRQAGYIESIPDIFICAGRPGGGVDSCEGDSGGPMVIRGPDQRWILAGIISWGIGCAEPNQPGVYTRISRFRDWINAILVF